jgi:hypothetical protein
MSRPVPLVRVTPSSSAVPAPPASPTNRLMSKSPTLTTLVLAAVVTCSKTRTADTVWPMTVSDTGAAG